MRQGTHAFEEKKSICARFFNEYISSDVTQLTSNSYDLLSHTSYMSKSLQSISILCLIDALLHQMRESIMFWCRRFGADVLFPTFWRRLFGAWTFWRQDVLAQRRFGAETFWRCEVLAPQLFFQN